MKNAKALPCGRRAPERKALGEGELTSIRRRLEDFLRANGQRFTEPRWKVAESILRSGLHMDAREILASIHRKGEAVGEATVYRAIHLLCDAGILEESHHATDGRPVYEIANDEHHDHIVCTDCGEIFEFHDEALETLQEKTAHRQGFDLVGHRHVLMGKCQFTKKGKRT